MKHFSFIFILSGLLFSGILLAGCGNQAKEWFETAELEVLQNSRDHARQLYQRIITEYPDSEYTAKAKERLESLNSPAQPPIDPAPAQMGGQPGTTPQSLPGAAQ